MVPFTLRQIEAFLSIAAHGSVRLAATDLGISQPAASRLIKSLEIQLGYPLLERQPGRQASLSPAGEKFRDQAQAFVESARILGSSRKPRMEQGVTPIRSYIGHHILSEYLRPLLPQFHSKHPSCMLKLVSERPRSRVIEDIKMGRLDFALFTTSSLVSVPAESIGEIGSGIYAAADYHLPDTSLETINAQPFVMPMQGTYEEALLGEAMRANGIRPTQVIARINFSEGRFAVTAQGRCVCYASDSAINAFPKFGLRKLVELSTWTRWLFIGQHVDPAIAQSLRNLAYEVAISGGNTALVDASGSRKWVT